MAQRSAADLLRLLYARSTPVQPGAGGTLASSRSKTRDPKCSAAVSEWKRHQATPQTFVQLAKCRAAAKLKAGATMQRAAGNEPMAQALEHRARAEHVTGPQRKAQAANLRAQRAGASLRGAGSGERGAGKTPAAPTQPVQKAPTTPTAPTNAPRPARDRSPAAAAQRIGNRVDTLRERVRENPQDEAARRQLERSRGRDVQAARLAQRGGGAGRGLEPGLFGKYRERRLAQESAAARQQPAAPAPAQAAPNGRGTPERSREAARLRGLREYYTTPRAHPWELASVERRIALTPEGPERDALVRQRGDLAAKLERQAFTEHELERNRFYPTKRDDTSDKTAEPVPAGGGFYRGERGRYRVYTPGQAVRAAARGKSAETPVEAAIGRKPETPAQTVYPPPKGQRPKFRERDIPKGQATVGRTRAAVTEGLNRGVAARRAAQAEQTRANPLAGLSPEIQEKYGRLLKRNPPATHADYIARAKAEHAATVQASKRSLSDVLGESVAHYHGGKTENNPLAMAHAVESAKERLKSLGRHEEAARLDNAWHALNWMQGTGRTSAEAGKRWRDASPAEKARLLGQMAEGATDTSVQGFANEYRRVVGGQAEAPAAQPAAAAPEPSPSGPKPKAPAGSGIEYVRAPAGGAYSDITGKHYKGGHWMPVHGHFAGQPKPEPTGAPKGKGSAPKPNPESKSGPRTPREKLTPEQIAERQRAAAERQKMHADWQTIRNGPLGTMLAMGEHPHKLKRYNPGLIGWRKWAESVGPEHVAHVQKLAEQIADRREFERLAERPHERKDANGREMTDDEIRQAVKEHNAWHAENTRQYLPKAHLERIPNSAEAVGAVGDAMGQLDDMLAIHHAMTTPPPAAAAPAPAAQPAAPAAKPKAPRGKKPAPAAAPAPAPAPTAAPPAAPSPAPRSPLPAPRESNFAADFHRAYDQANATGKYKGGDLVSLHALRSALPQYSREEFDAGLRKLRQDRQYTGESHEGLHGPALTPEEKAAGIPVKGPTPDTPGLLAYMKRNTEHPAFASGTGIGNRESGIGQKPAAAATPALSPRERAAARQRERGNAPQSAAEKVAQLGADQPKTAEEHDAMAQALLNAARQHKGAMRERFAGRAYSHQRAAQRLREQLASTPAAAAPKPAPAPAPAPQATPAPAGHRPFTAEQETAINRAVGQKRLPGVARGGTVASNLAVSGGTGDPNAAIFRAAVEARKTGQTRYVVPTAGGWATSPHPSPGGSHYEVTAQGWRPVRNTPPASAPAPAAPAGPKPATPATPATFAQQALAAAARVGPEGRFGGDKVFISHAHKAFAATPEGRGMSLEQFKRNLLVAHQGGQLTMSRADMLSAMNPQTVKESEIAQNFGPKAEGERPDVSYHFLRPEPAAAPKPAPAAPAPQVFPGTVPPGPAPAPSAAYGGSAVTGAEFAHLFKPEGVKALLDSQAELARKLGQTRYLYPHRHKGRGGPGFMHAGPNPPPYGGAHYVVTPTGTKFVPATSAPRRPTPPSGPGPQPRA